MIIPSLDLINGNVVRLHQGNYSKEYNYKKNPLVYLQLYKKQGAKICHIVDLNAAKNPNNHQRDILKILFKNITISIQIGGGIRNKKDIDFLFKIGAKRIVISSIAIENIKYTKNIIQEYGPNKIVLAFDVCFSTIDSRYVIFIHGWQKETKIFLEDIIEEFLPFGIKHILCTDINKDGTLKGSNIHLYKEIIKKYPKIFLQSSGGVNSLPDINRLKKSGVHSVIIGRAFLENKFTLREAISCWQNE